MQGALQFISTQGPEAERKALDRLKDIQCATSADCLAFHFARILIPSAIAAYGRPLIDSSEKEGSHSVTFEWLSMFWLIKKDGMSVVINDEAEKALEFTQDDLEPFISDFMCIPNGMPSTGNQSKFKE